MNSLCIKNGNIVTSQGIIEEACLFIKNGKIIGISKDDKLLQSEEIINANSKLVLPGAIDIHPHIDDPAFFQNRENFETGTKSAIVGGITSMVEMPTWNPLLEESVIKDKIERGGKTSFIDFKLHAGNVKNVLTKILVKNLKEIGITSYKVFTCDPYLCTDYAIYRNLELYGNEVTFMFHAENNDILKGIKEEIDKKGLKSAKFHHLSRPPIAEVEAVNRIILMVKTTNSKAHFVHISVKDSVDLIKKAKENGTRISVETCPHYLYFTIKDMEKLGPYLKVNPPVRSNEDRMALIKYLNEGIIDIVASDHYPTFRDEREKGWENVDEVRAGLPGIATLYQSMINLMLEGIISPIILVKTLSENPARLFGLYPLKGGIRIGADADIVIVNQKGTVKVTPERFKIHSGWTPFEGFIFKGAIERVILRGKTIVEDYELKVEKPMGHYLKVH